MYNSCIYRERERDHFSICLTTKRVYPTTELNPPVFFMIRPSYSKIPILPSSSMVGCWSGNQAYYHAKTKRLTTEHPVIFK